MKEKPKEILNGLHQKFSNNFALSMEADNKELPKAFLLIKGIAEIGQILCKRDLQKHQIRCCNIFDEIFADMSISIYLAANSLDKPAMIVLRRALELGVAVVYLWDMPHLLYSWDILEKDLSFSEMLSHICGDGFIHFVKEENKYLEIKKLIDAKKTNRIYGQLSDTVHGKIKTFETELESKYSYVEKDWNDLIDITIEIAQLLLHMYMIRFNSRTELISALPSVEKYFGDADNV